MGKQTVSREEPARKRKNVPYPLYKRAKHAIPTFGSSRAHTPITLIGQSLNCWERIGGLRVNH